MMPTVSLFTGKEIPGGIMVESLTASGHLRRLRDLDLIEQKGKRAATYYIPGRRLATDQPLPPVPASGSPGTPVSPASSPPGKPLSEGLPPLPEGVPPLPEGLATQLQGLDQRAKPAALRAVIAGLCAHYPIRPADVPDRDAERKQTGSWSR